MAALPQSLPGEKSGRPLQYVTLLPEDLVLLQGWPSGTSAQGSL